MQWWSRKNLLAGRARQTLFLVIGGKLDVEESDTSYVVSVLKAVDFKFVRNRSGALLN